ncbi:MAG: ABC transporter ATP-binding protein [Thermoplasmata archaeon]|jgi:ABC-2 type transport system ATP-binding protein
MLKVIDICKRFENKLVLENISFEIKRGMVFSYLGPNGAGKTTTIRILSGILKYDCGKIIFNDEEMSPHDVRLRKRSGLLTENPGFYERFDAIKNLKFFGSLHGLNENDLNDRINRMLKEFDLFEYKDKPVGTYSKGMKQKLALIRALIHDPDIVYLDEPTASLDPETSIFVRNLILNLRKNGKGVFLSTHNLNEAEQLSDWVALINKKIVIQGPIEKLKSMLFGKNIIIEFRGDLEKVKTILKEYQFEIYDHKIRLKNVEDISKILKELIYGDINVYYVYQEEHNLEEIYLEMISK